MKTKQIIMCVFFTTLFHILSSFMGGSFNPFEWKGEGDMLTLSKMVYATIVLFIWLTPIHFNYLKGNDYEQRN